MAIHVIIPSRYGSSRFPGKPLVDIGGKPMVRRVMEQVSQAKGVETVAVATDDERIAEAVRAFGGKVIISDQPMRTGSDRVAAAANELGLGPDELVVNVQGDQPLLPPEVIDEVAAPLLADPCVLVSTPVTRIKRPEEIADTNHVKTVMDIKGDAIYFRAWPCPTPGTAARSRSTSIWACISSANRFWTYSPGCRRASGKHRKARATQGVGIRLQDALRDYRKRLARSGQARGRPPGGRDSGRQIGCIGLGCLYAPGR